LPTAIRSISSQVFYLAYINANQAVAYCDAFFNFVFYPSATTGVLSDKNNGNRCSFQLAVYPTFNSSVSLALYLFKISCIYETGRLLALRNGTCYLGAISCVCSA
jgi:hypothetical protein